MTLRGRTAVTVSVLIGMLLIILLLSIWTHSRTRHQPRQIPVLVYERAVKQRPKNVMVRELVDSIPLVMYSTVLQAAKELDRERDEEANMVPGHHLDITATKDSTGT